MSAALPQAASQNYPLLNVFWTMLWFFLWILWIFLLIRIFIDIFRSDDMGGWAKAGWSIFVIIVPFLGVLVYVIARGSGMAKRDQQQAVAADQAARSYIQSAAGASTSVAEEVNKLAALRDQGVLTEQEFETQKAKVLG
jgi:Short C-terminal domain/Phospholipase_D-nuclease N-terminal